MKKWMVLVVTLACVFGLIGCGRTMNDVIGKEPDFVGIVAEVLEDSILVNMDSGEAEYDNCPIVMVPLNVEIADSYLDCSVGDEVVVYYDGRIVGGEPAQVEKVYAITLKTPADRTESISSSVEETEDMGEIPGGTRFIIEIRDRTEEEELVCAEAEELFYEDETTGYYFNVIKSHYIIVTYNDCSSEDIVTALNAGRATIADLDEFGIEYHTEPKK